MVMENGSAFEKMPRQDDKMGKRLAQLREMIEEKDPTNVSETESLLKTIRRAIDLGRDSGVKVEKYEAELAELETEYKKSK